MANPTVITTVEQLEDINNNLSGDYVLGGDIDASGFNFIPIGTANDPFTGTLDGDGYTINGLTISASDQTSYFGLFGYVGASGEIKDVNLTNANIATSASLLPTNSFVGALAGWNDGTISQSSSSGSVGTFGHVFATVGGLVGGNAGTIETSRSSASVANDIKPAGGLLGYNAGTVTESFATGSVTGGGFPSTSGGFVGGLVGLNDTGGQVSDSFANGPVFADDGTIGYSGGLVGLNHGSITQAYAIGAVTGNNYVGGLVAYNDGSVSQSYWNTQTTGQENDGDYGNFTDSAKAETTAQLQSGDLPSGFDPTIWGASSGQYPYLLNSQLAPPAIDTADSILSGNVSTATGGIDSTSGFITFEDAGAAALPTASIVSGSESLVATKEDGSSYTLTPAEISTLETE